MVLFDGSKRTNFCRYLAAGAVFRCRAVVDRDSDECGVEAAQYAAGAVADHEVTEKEMSWVVKLTIEREQVTIGRRVLNSRLLDFRG